MSKSERYFLVFYKGYHDTSVVEGMHTFEYKSCYLNLNLTVERLKKSHDLHEVTITNIIELSESDYNDFILEYEN